MSIHRRLAVGVVAALALASAGSALAASPQAIYRDLADNGRLDRKYKRADLQRALDLSAIVHTDARRPRPRDRNLEPEAPAAAPAPRVDRSEAKRLPFSGLDLALLIAGSGPLLVIGAGLRRRLAPAPSEAPVASA